MLKEFLIASQMACMSEALYYEGRSEGFHGMVTIGAVIYNRAIDSRWGDSICDVIEQPHQFSYLPSGVDSGTLAMPDKEAREEAEQAAYAVLSAGDGKPLLNNILYYHADYVTPRWDYDLLHESLVLGAHIFYEDYLNDYRYE